MMSIVPQLVGEIGVSKLFWKPAILGELSVFKLRTTSASLEAAEIRN
jgi:hypothetical protein